MLRTTTVQQQGSQWAGPKPWAAVATRGQAACSAAARATERTSRSTAAPPLHVQRLRLRWRRRLGPHIRECRTPPLRRWRCLCCSAISTNVCCCRRAGAAAVLLADGCSSCGSLLVYTGTGCCCCCCCFSYCRGHAGGCCRQCRRSRGRRRILHAHFATRQLAGGPHLQRCRSRHTCHCNQEGPHAAGSCRRSGCQRQQRHQQQRCRGAGAGDGNSQVFFQPEAIGIGQHLQQRGGGRDEKDKPRAHINALPMPLADMHHHSSCAFRASTG